MDAALDLIPSLTRERAYLAGLAANFRATLQAAGLDTGPSNTQIVPLILGREEKALTVSQALRQEGYLAIAIRPPTVPNGTSRIRFALSAAHAQADIARLAEATIRLTRSS
jgi:8-amino-7-oxononanoate synthase